MKHEVRIQHPKYQDVYMETLLTEHPKGAVIIVAGGGYHRISPREQFPVAREYQKAGYDAFVFWYSIDNPPLMDVPMQEMGWAVSQVRERAAKYGYASNHIAVCGFSAGAHVAGSLGVNWHRPECFEAGTNLEMQKPNTMILSYPVITSGRFAHRGSFTYLAGTDESKWERYSLEKRVTEHTPTVFLWHTLSDHSVPVENTLLFSESLRKYNIEQEVHLYPRGVHGMSVATKEVENPEKNCFADPHVATWMRLSIEWLDMQFRENVDEN